MAWTCRDLDYISAVGLQSVANSSALAVIKKKKKKKVRLGFLASGSQRSKPGLATAEDLEMQARIGNTASECRERQG